VPPGLSGEGLIRNNLLREAADGTRRPSRGTVLKILHIIPSANRAGGGPIEGLVQIGGIMAELGVEQSVLTLDAPTDPHVHAFPRQIFAGGPPHRTGSGALARLGEWARFSPDAREWARRNVRDYDAVVVNSLWNYATRVARLALVGSGVPYVVYPHGMLDPWFRRRYPLKHAAKQALWLFNEGPLIRNADAVLFTCEQERLLARQTFWPYRARERVVPYGAGEPPPADPAQIAAFRALVPALGDRPYLLFLSRIHEKKGCDLLVDAFARVASLAPDLDLVIAGPDQVGLVATLQQQAKALGIGHRIHWPGMVEGAAKYGAFRGADAFVLPSHQENFGIVVAEALACDCPVLISDQVNIWREVEQAGAGLVAPDTLKGTEHTLRRWLALKNTERRTMRTRCRPLFDEKFTVRAAAMGLVQVLEDVIAARKARAVEAALP